MKKFGITLLCACVAVVSVLFSYYMTRATGSNGELSVETVYAMAQDAGYCGTLTDFINEFKGAVGNDGRGVATAEINSDGHLIITYTDMTTIDAGLVSADTINASGAISGLSLNYALTSSVSICCRAAEETSVSGAGIIYALDKTQGTAYVMTNYHVLYNDVAGARFENSSISVYLYGMELENVPTDIGQIDFTVKSFKQVGKSKLRIYDEAVTVSFKNGVVDSTLTPLS